MFGQGCDFEDGVLEPLPLLGVVVVPPPVPVEGLDCVVLGLDGVVLAALLLLDAAAAPEMPTSTPPAPSTAVISNVLSMFVRFIGLNLQMSHWGFSAPTEGYRCPLGSIAVHILRPVAKEIPWFV
jgi:hypothetical protein